MPDGRSCQGKNIYTWCLCSCSDGSELIKLVVENDNMLGKASHLINPQFDIDECSQLNGGCEYLCINGPGSFICACEHGYLLMPDGRSCQGKLF